jgi:hypothetical protein
MIGWLLTTAWADVPKPGVEMPEDNANEPWRGGYEFPDEIATEPYQPPQSKLVALAHAPVHHQDTDSSNALADYLTSVDYDGDWVTTNNWDNLYRGDHSAVVYYSVVEGCNHWFVLYAMYHPRDWGDLTSITNRWEHENDMEGLLAIISKEGDLGHLEGIVTVAHSDFYSYVPRDTHLGEGAEDGDGIVSFEEIDGQLHPKTAQEAKGHGLGSWPYRGDFDTDHIVYWPSDYTVDTPESGDDRDVTYRLVSLFEDLWPNQLADAQASAPVTFATCGTIQGDSSGSCGEGLTFFCADDAAQTPWAWNDHDDGPPGPGDLALDPASLAARYFAGLAGEDLLYVENKYAEDLRDVGFTDAYPPSGWSGETSLDELYTRLDATCR